MSSCASSICRHLHRCASSASPQPSSTKSGYACSNRSLVFNSRYAHTSTHKIPPRVPQSAHFHTSISGLDRKGSEDNGPTTSPDTHRKSRCRSEHVTNAQSDATPSRPLKEPPSDPPTAASTEQMKQKKTWRTIHRLPRQRMDQLRTLHESEPERWTIEALARQFFVPKEAVRRILSVRPVLLFQ